MRGICGLAAGVAFVALSLSGCDGDKPATSQVDYQQVSQAAAQGEAAFKSQFEAFRGKRVRWSGTVVEVIREFGDDYAQLFFMHVDMDPPGAAAPRPDVLFEIKPSQFDAFKPGQPITFSGIIREYVVEGGNILLKLQAEEVT
jgi:hypothetical protein